MEKEEFIKRLKEVLEIKDSIIITESTNLKDIEGYDSLSVLSIIAMIDEYYQKKLPGSTFESLTTVSSLMEKIGIN
jgi:acyl carrier protein